MTTVGPCNAGDVHDRKIQAAKRDDHHVVVAYDRAMLGQDRLDARHNVRGRAEIHHVLSRTPRRTNSLLGKLAKPRGPTGREVHANGAQTSSLPLATPDASNRTISEPTRQPGSYAVTARMTRSEPPPCRKPAGQHTQTGTDASVGWTLGELTTTQRTRSGRWKRCSGSCRTRPHRPLRLRSGAASALPASSTTSRPRSSSRRTELAPPCTSWAIDSESTDAPSGRSSPVTLFAGAEFPTSEGTTLDLGDQRRVDLARKVRDLGYSGPFPLPRDPEVAQRARDNMLVLEAVTKAEIERRASTYVSADLVPEATEQVTRKWVRKSIASLREQLNATTELSLNGPDLFASEGLVPRSEADEEQRSS